MENLNLNKGKEMHWQNFLNDTMKSFSNLSKEIPETFKGFETMGKAAKKSGVCCMC